MKPGVALPLLAGFAVAAKIPVMLPTDNVECKARPYNGPLVTNPDTSSAFKAYGRFRTVATMWAADQNTPDNYATVPGFVNLNAAAEAPDYLSSIEPESYDPVECAAYCDKEPTCTSFNICNSPLRSSLAAYWLTMPQSTSASPSSSTPRPSSPTPRSAPASPPLPQPLSSSAPSTAAT
jgi:hypothetical protein